MHLDSRVRLFAALALALTTTAACGSAASSASVAEGDPVAGGEATFLVAYWPNSLDPARMQNTSSTDAVVGNALYGALIETDRNSGEVTYRLAEELNTDDGVVWTLRLRDGLTFSDGTALDAAAVQYSWTRMQDSATAAPDASYARALAELEVTSPNTLEFSLDAPNYAFSDVIAGSAMNWIASPAALAQGPEVFSENPIGAGPFALDKWTRDAEIALSRNESYWDAPRPYLDKLTVRALPDQKQRRSTLTTGDAELMITASPQDRVAAEESGFLSHLEPTAGGTLLAFNMTRAPFDDIRARRAVDAAIDRDAINTIRSGGNGTVPATLFPETSEFYEPDLEINGYDPERAQRLLDELAADGKPLKFTILSYPGTNTTVAAQAIQSQLGAYDNVTVEIEVQDFAGITARTIAHDFDANTSGMFFGRPEPELSRRLASDSRGNITGIVDPEIDEALRVARRTDDAGVRRQAYATIQERFIDQVPMVIYERNEVAVVHAPSIGGVAEYGAGSPKVDTLWLAPTDTE